MAIKVLVVDDHTIIRSSLRVLLEQQSEVDVVGDSADGMTAIELARQLSPDVVLMDVMLRGSEVSGIEATQKITEVMPETKVIALSVVEEITYVKRILAAGATGYLFKGCTEEELVEAIHSVVKGQSYFSEGALQVVQEDYVTTAQSQGNYSKLTVREMEILKLIASGLPTKGIAAELRISRKTVDAHKRNIMEKLEMWSVAELTRYALKEGIIVEEK